MTAMNEFSNQSEPSKEFVAPNSTDMLEKLAKLLKINYGINFKKRLLLIR